MTAPTGTIVFGSQSGQAPQGGTGLVVPDVSDAARDIAEQLLKDQGFVVRTEDVESLGGTDGTVLRQDPQAGQRRPKGSVVILYIRRKSPAATDPLAQISTDVASIVTAVGTVTTGLTQVTTDLGNTSTGVGTLTADLGKVKTDLQSVAGDLVQVRSDLAKVLGLVEDIKAAVGGSGGGSTTGRASAKTAG
jgi:hypothetical protein